MLDYYLVSDLLTSEERQIQATVHDFLQDKAMPHVSQWWEEAIFPKNSCSS